MTSTSATRDTARRFAPPGWRDARLWLGVALLVGSMAIGAVVLGDRSDTVLVLRAARDLSVGAPVLDVAPVAVPAEVAAGYLRADEVTDGSLRLPVAAGDLVPRSALSGPSTAPVRAVTVAVEPLHAPSGLAAGDRVDLWSTATASTTDPASAARLVLADVLVTGVAADDAGLSGGSGVTLEVPQARVGDVVRAGRGAVIDLVAVPIGAQAGGS
jgi:hypothetical protein